MKKTINTFLSFLITFSMIFSLVGINDAVAALDVGNEFDCECQTAKYSSECLVSYGAKNVEKITSEQADELGLSKGYSDNLIKVSGSYSDTGLGLLLDFSKKQIPQYLIKDITFRVYVDTTPTGNYPEIRIQRPYKKDEWSLRYSATKEIKQWVDITMGSDGTNFYQGDISDFCKDGYLDKFNLLVRMNYLEEFYIDSIKVNLLDDDKTGPIITCDEKLYFTENKMPEIKAYDESEKRNVDYEIIWPDGTALDENNIPAAGNYSITIKAKDYFGNVTEKKVEAVVIATDKTKPEITVQADEIYAITGMIPFLSATATDDSGMTPTITYEWSEGALDSKDCLTKGTHTWTIKAIDGSNNVATKEVKVYVTDEEYFGENVNIVDESALYGDDQDHVMKYYAAKPATCTTDGNIAYYYCSDCGKCFADEAGNKELSKVAITIKATGHKEVVVKGKVATTEKTGLTDGSKCSVCGKVIIAQKTIAKIAKPKATKITKVTKGKKKINIKFKKIKTISGYELQVARNRKMKKGTKKYQIKSSKTSYTVKKLKAKTNYWVRIRTYKKVNNTTVYSNWSKTVKVKTK